MNTKMTGPMPLTRQGSSRTTLEVQVTRYAFIVIFKKSLPNIIAFDKITDSGAVKLSTSYQGKKF
jgi:hypothetical protein